jgi:transcription antitermination factor NusG
VPNAEFSVDDVQNVNRFSRWFAVRVKSQHERMVATGIRHKGLAEFLPLYQCRRRWSDRFKSVELPLFPGYVFCQIDPAFRMPVLTLPGVMHFVGIGRIPVPIEDEEILAIQSAMHSGLRVEPSAYLNVGQRVRLEDGPLAGLEGILIEIRKQYRVVVSLTLLKRSVAVEIDRDWLSPVGAKTGIPRYSHSITIS